MKNLEQMSSKVVLCNLIHLCCLHLRFYLYEHYYTGHLSKVDHGALSYYAVHKEYLQQIFWKLLVIFQLWADGNIGVEDVDSDLKI